MQGNSQFIIFMIVMAFSVLSWVIGYLKEQSRIKKAKDEQRKRFEESLRTGRPVEEAARPTDPAAELAARRQAQLQELRRQQMEERSRGGGTVVVRAPSGTGQARPGQSGQGFPLPVPPTGTPQQRPGRGQVVVQRTPAGQRSAQRQQPQQPARERRDATPPTFNSGNDPAVLAARRQREQAERESAAQIATRKEDRESERRAAELAVHDREKRLAAAASSRATAAALPKGPRGLLLDPSGNMSPQSLRRAIVLAEIFNKPVSQRGE